MQSFRRLFKGDYPANEQSFVDQLSGSLNTGIESLYNALKNNVSLEDNVYCVVQTLTFKVNAAGTPTPTLTFSVASLATKVLGLSILNMVNGTNSTTYPTTAPFASFTQNGTSITINNISGLKAGDTWTMTVVAWGT